MNFSHPLMLLLFAGLPLFALLLLLDYRHTRKTVARLTPQPRQEKSLKAWMIRNMVSGICLLIFYGTCVMALAQPRWGEDFVEEDRQGLDILIVLDVSRSMLVQDMEPDRLSRARETLLAFSAEYPDARMGLVLLRGRAVVTLPLTDDRIALEKALYMAGSYSMTVQGTDLGDGLFAAFQAFPENSNRFRMVLLVSDGEDFGDQAREAALQARKQGIPIVAFGIGSEAGGPVPLPDGTFQTLANGQQVISAMNAALLQELAEVSRGLFISSMDNRSYTRLAATVQGFHDNREVQGYRLVDIEQDRLFILIAIATLASSVLVRSIRWKGTWS